MGWATTVKNLPVLFRVGTRRGGYRQRTPQHSMVVVPVRRSRERRIDLSAGSPVLVWRDRTAAPRGAIWTWSRVLRRRGELHDESVLSCP